MKKLLLLFALVAITASAAAQDSHLKFKGVEIYGTLDDCVERYKAANESAILVESDDKSACFRDELCEIKGFVVLKSEKETGMYSITFLSDKCEFWSSIKSNYSMFHDMLSEKYGQPQFNKQEFEYPYDKGNHKGFEMTAVSLGKCKYMAVWSMPNGKIKLAISQSGKIFVSYEDKDGDENHQSLKKKRYKNQL